MTWTEPPLRPLVYRVPCPEPLCAAPVGSPCYPPETLTHLSRIVAETELTAARSAALRSTYDPTGLTDGSIQLALELPGLPPLL